MTLQKIEAIYQKLLLTFISVVLKSTCQHYEKKNTSKDTKNKKHVTILRKLFVFHFSVSNQHKNESYNLCTLLYYGKY